MEPMLRTSPPAVTEVGEPESAAEGKSEEDRNTTDDKLESTRTKMGEVKRENERLKSTLAQIMKDYQSLEMHYFDIIKQDQRETSVREEHSNANHQTDESELSLSLGTSSSGGQKKEEKAAAAAASMVGKTSKDQDDQLMKGVLTLGLDSRFNGSCSDHRETQRNASPGSSVEEIKEEDAPADKVFNSVGRSEEDGDALGLNPAKRARVSVRVRCDAPTMNDGCQWRKYGQKIAKGNPCPRAYYRCTVAPSCPVRKQVQRCPEDMSILITTYEGTHNHPLPVSAAAMASTTSAAASMLMSGSSVSRPLSSGAGDYAGGNSVAAGLHGLSFGLSDLSRQRQLIYPPNSSMYSSSPSCPTITLDLTAPASSSSTPTQLISRLSGYPPKTLNNFSISQSSSMATATTTWNSAAGHLQYFPTHPFASRSGSEIGISSLGSRQPHQEAQMYNSLIQKATQLAPLAGTQGSLTDTAIAAAAKVITSDPSFQSALAAAITSIVGGNGGSQVSVAEPPRGRSNSVWEEKSVPTLSPFTPPSTNGSGCGSSFLTKSSSSSSSRLDSQQGSALTFIQPPLAVPSSKSTPTSPSDHAK